MGEYWVALIIIGAFSPVRMADLPARTSLRAALHGVAPKKSSLSDGAQLSVTPQVPCVQAITGRVGGAIACPS